jgi:hypothetical protein
MLNLFSRTGPAFFAAVWSIKISVTLLSDSLDEMGGRRCYRNMDRQLGVYFLLSRFDVVQLSAVLHRLPDRSRYAFLSVLMISFNCDFFKSELIPWKH